MPASQHQESQGHLAKNWGSEGFGVWELGYLHQNSQHLCHLTLEHPLPYLALPHFLKNRLFRRQALGSGVCWGATEGFGQLKVWSFMQRLTVGFGQLEIWDFTQQILSRKSGVRQMC